MLDTIFAFFNHFPGIAFALFVASGFGALAGLGMFNRTRS